MPSDVLPVHTFDVRLSEVLIDCTRIIRVTRRFRVTRDSLVLCKRNESSIQILRTF